MLQVVYISTATREYHLDTLAQILGISRMNNTRDGITGMLCYHGGTFFQMLEGEASAVRATLSRIAKDSRHHGVTVLLEHDVSEHDLPDWSMAFREVSAREAPALKGFSALLKSGDNARLADEKVARSEALALISGFRNVAAV